MTGKGTGMITDTATGTGTGTANANGADTATPAMPRVAVAGCGYWGINLVRNFHAVGALAAVCEAAPARAAELSAQFGVPALSFEQVLADPGFDAVVLATPAETHAALALRVIDAGKHVFVEKPLALAAEDAEKVRKAAEARGRVVMVGHLMQYHPAFLRLRQLVAEGGLGRLRYIYSNRLNLGKFRRQEDVFWSFAPHDISMILALAGDTPETVQTVGHSYLYNGIADVTTTHLTFGSGINAHIFVSWLHPYKEQRLVVVGDSGMAVFDDSRPWAEKLVHYPHRVAWRDGMPQPDKADAIAIDLLPAEPLRLECLHFLECVRKNGRPRTDVAEGIGVLSVLDAARRSMKSGRPAALKEAAPAAPEAPPYFAHPTACVDDGAVIGAGTRIWYFSHILKNTVIGRGSTIAHGAIIHGCGIGENTLVGMNAVVLDNAEIGPECLIAALSLVKSDTIVPARSLVVGNPAKVVKTFEPHQVTWKNDGKGEYQRLAREALTDFIEVTPLAQVEQNRQRLRSTAIAVRLTGNTAAERERRAAQE